MTKQYLTDSAEIHVFDHEQNRKRTFKLTTKDKWGFIGDDKENTVTELALNKNKLPLTTLKHIFNGDSYLANYDDKVQPERVDDDGRIHTWSQVNGKVLHNVADPALAERYSLTSVIENGKDLLAMPEYHFLADPKINEAAYLINDETDQPSGAIIPTTKKALANLRRAVKTQEVDLEISPDSEVRFAGNLPTGSLKNNSTLSLAPKTGAHDVRLDNSEVSWSNGQLSNVSFDNCDAKSSHNEGYLYNSDLNHVKLAGKSDVKGSIIDYAKVEDANISDSLLKGGKYENAEIEHSSTWLNLASAVTNTHLHNTRVEDRNLSMKDYARDLPNVDKPTPEQEKRATVINDSDLDNIQLIQSGDTGSTLDNVHLKNAFVIEWLIAKNSSIIVHHPGRPVVAGKLIMDDNKIDVSKHPVTFNMDIYHSEDAEQGLELPKGKTYDDKALLTEPNAVPLNSNDPTLSRLAILENGHYSFGDIDNVFENAGNLVGDDGGASLRFDAKAKANAAKMQAAKKAKTAAKTTEPTDEPEP